MPNTDGDISSISAAIASELQAQKDKAGRPDIDAFEAVMTREDWQKGFFVSFDFTRDALQEINAFFRKGRKVIVALTASEILDQQLARKPA